MNDNKRKQLGLCSFFSKNTKAENVPSNENSIESLRFKSRLLAQCQFYRLSCIAGLIVVTFLISITQELTYVLNFRNYLSTPSRLEDQEASTNWFSKKLLNLPMEPESHASGKNVSTNKSDDWHRITNGTYGYSAYWDNRFNNHPFIRIVAGSNRIDNQLRNLKCLVRTNSSTDVYDELSVTYKVLKEHHLKPARAIYIECTPTFRDPPDSVSVVPYSWNKTWTLDLSWMKVHRLQDNDPPTRLSLCVRPLFNYTDVFRIVEFVSYYEALGVEHFTFYNYDSVHDVRGLIALLREQNYSIDMLPWSLPLEIASMWALGQIASINDCIYRQMSTASHVVVVDLDEFVTPRHVVTLPELLSVQTLEGRKFSEFVFRSCVFCSEYAPDTLPDVIPPFVTQTNIRRENRIYPFLDRTKYIVAPRQVVVAGVHFVWESVKGSERRLVPASEVMVHHYRAKLCVGKDKTIEKGEIDPMSRKYLNQVMRSKALSIWKGYFIPVTDTIMHAVVK